MIVLHLLLLATFFSGCCTGSKEIISEEPFYIRARVHDAHSATVLFEIPRENDHRQCQKYRFTVRRNQEVPYSMSEENFTYWRNSLELKDLSVGHYNVCAIICSERIRTFHSIFFEYRRNISLPIISCVAFKAHRSHFLILTLYLLVLIFLIISQINYSLRKREVRERLHITLLEMESSIQKWRSSQSAAGAASSMDQTPSYNILQSIVNLPLSPVEHAVTSPTTTITSAGEHHPIIFHLDSSQE